MMAHSTWELNYITGDPEDETLSSSNQIRTLPINYMKKVFKREGDIR